MGLGEGRFTPVNLFVRGLISGMLDTFTTKVLKENCADVQKDVYYLYSYLRKTIKFTCLMLRHCSLLSTYCKCFNTCTNVKRAQIALFWIAWEPYIQYLL